MSTKPTINLDDSKSELWQWDTGRYLSLPDTDAKEVHISRGGMRSARVVKIQEQKAVIPDGLLVFGGRLFVYVVQANATGEMTVYDKWFDIQRRPKPDDYIYTDDEVRQWEQLEERLSNIESNGVVMSHEKLLNRDSDDQHPISAITGLTTALNNNSDAASVAMKAAQTAGSTAAAAQDTANTAVKNADKAQQAADDAASVAEKARTSADDAQTAANRAQKTADTANTATASLKNQITTALYGTTEKTLTTNDDFEWQGGWYHTDGTLRDHPIFKRSRVFRTLPGTTIMYENLRSPANYIACIACFKDGKYDDAACLKGESFLDFSSGTFVVPENINEVSFETYLDGARETSVTLTVVEPISETNKSKIATLESENLKTREDIEEVKQETAEIYNAKEYTIANGGFAIAGKYYDKEGNLNDASNMSTTGILAMPLGIKKISYTAYRNIEIPTIVFYNLAMQVVGIVIATTQPVYGDYLFSGVADIPIEAVYMSFSTLNTIDDSKIVVTYSRITNNTKRIEKLENDPLNGLKISCTGNSVTAATHSVPGQGYVEQIADAHGMAVDNHAIWGAVIPQGHPRPIGDVEDVGCIHDTIAQMDADADIVILSGSINDCEYYNDSGYLGAVTEDYSSNLNLNTFCGALESICKNALQKWSGKPIIYVIEHRTTLDNTTYGQFYLKLHEAIVKIMAKWGISVVDLFLECPSLSHNEGYKTQYTTGDGVHPNHDGYAKFYVPRVYSEIKKIKGI